MTLREQLAAQRPVIIYLAVVSHSTVLILTCGVPSPPLLASAIAALAIASIASDAQRRDQLKELIAAVLAIGSQLFPRTRGPDVQVVWRRGPEAALPLRDLVRLQSAIEPRAPALGILPTAQI